MNWGKKLMIVFILFAVMIMTMVVLSMRQHFDMVTDNYYEEELKFQDQIDAEKNAASFAPGIVLAITPDSIELNLPPEGRADFKEGSILFYRASDASLDVKQNLSVDESGTQLFDRKNFVSGSYEVKISWRAGGKTFYHQTTIHL